MIGGLKEKIRVKVVKQELTLEYLKKVEFTFYRDLRVEEKKRLKGTTIKKSDYPELKKGFRNNCFLQSGS